MTPLGRFEYQHGPFRYIVQIHQDGDTGYQENSQTGKVRQLVRGTTDVDLVRGQLQSCMQDDAARLGHLMMPRPSAAPELNAPCL